MIASITTNPSTGLVTAPSPERQAFTELAKSLRSGDVDAAKQSYANLVRNAPEGKTWPKGSNFADLGKALVQGDMDAARTAFASMVKERIGTPPVKGGGVADVDNAGAAVPSSTGGDSGALLSVVA